MQNMSFLFYNKFFHKTILNWAMLYCMDFAWIRYSNNIYGASLFNLKQIDTENNSYIEILNMTSQIKLIVGL